MEKTAITKILCVLILSWLTKELEGNVLGPVSADNYSPWPLLYRLLHRQRYISLENESSVSLPNCLTLSSPWGEHKNQEVDDCNAEELQNQINDLKQEIQKRSNLIQSLLMDDVIQHQNPSDDDGQQLENYDGLPSFRPLNDNGDYREPRLNSFFTQRHGQPWIRNFFQFRRYASFSTLNTPITYEIQDYNIGFTVVGYVGIFTAPRSGYYFFSFNGMTDDSDNSVNVVFQINYQNVTACYGQPGGLTQLSMQTVAKLKFGDLVTYELTAPVGVSSASAIYEDGFSYFTRFVGFWLF